MTLVFYHLMPYFELTLLIVDLDVLLEVIVGRPGRTGVQYLKTGVFKYVSFTSKSQCQKSKCCACAFDRDRSSSWRNNLSGQHKHPSFSSHSVA